MAPRLFIGIDPGKSGGIAWLTVYKNKIIAEAVPMPPTEHDLHRLIKGLTKRSEVWRLATIEKVHAMPKQGVKSVWTFAQNYGMLRAFIIASQTRLEEVNPRTWQKTLGISPRAKTATTTQWKNSLKAKAQQLFPELENITLKTADALLIAEYARRTAV